jgi:hypothetical protein
MIVPVMRSAQRYGELITYLASHRAGLSEAQMVGVCGASPANQTGLRGNVFEMCFIAMPTRLADHQLALLDFDWASVDLKMC